MPATKALLLAAALICANCTSAKQPAAPAADTAVKILNFYAREGDVTEGSATVLCYAVENAKAVTMEPPSADGVWPSRNRCVEVRPTRETTYTLQAEGADGRTVSQSLNVEVKADQDALPRVSSFRIESCSRDYANKPIFKLSFSAGNVVEVSIDPPVFETLHGSPTGEFYVTPEKNTTYTLIVTGKHGHVAKRDLTVDISKCR
jgi:hypothetical protein